MGLRWYTINKRDLIGTKSEKRGLRGTKSTKRDVSRTKKKMGLLWYKIFQKGLK